MSSLPSAPCNVWYMRGLVRRLCTMQKALFWFAERKPGGAVRSSSKTGRAPCREASDKRTGDSRSRVPLQAMKPCHSSCIATLCSGAWQCSARQPPDNAMNAGMHAHVLRKRKSRAANCAAEPRDGRCRALGQPTVLDCWAARHARIATVRSLQQAGCKLIQCTTSQDDCSGRCGHNVAAPQRQACAPLCCHSALCRGARGKTKQHYQKARNCAA